jgi:ElaB/YqjD/DUF883 family membrane-anchored ribosome-binding protein
MAEVWRATALPESSTNVTPTEDAVAANLPELPAPASNPAWNRSAEAVGRSVGTAVSEVRRLPRRLDDLRSRIHLVSLSAGESAHGIRNSAEAKAAELRDAAELGLLELADKAAVYTSEMGWRASSRLDHLRREARWRLEAVRTIARHRVTDVRRWQPERPLQVIAVSASAAFAVGVLLRIWRSNRD